MRAIDVVALLGLVMAAQISAQPLSTQFKVPLTMLSVHFGYCCYSRC